MSRFYVRLTVFLLVVAITLILTQSRSASVAPTVLLAAQVTPTSTMSAKTQKVLTDLIACESGGDENALNPKDKDNTPSYGLLQFKPDTLYWAVHTYGIAPNIEKAEIMNVIYEGDLQVKAFLAMYGDGQPISWWAQQFPACSKLHNYWR